MRTTVRIDDDILEALKARAEDDGASLAGVLNTVLRQGLAVADGASASEPFVQEVFSLGEMMFDVDKALSVAASLEDEAVLAKLAARK